MRKEKAASKKGYKVLDNGNLIGLDNKKIGYVANTGYEHFTMRYNGKHLKISTHRLQAYQKYGDIIYNSKIVVRHLNGNKLDNTYHNIAIGTIRDNMLDIPKEKRIEIAKNAATKYSDEKVKQIKDYYFKVRSYKKVLNKFNITSKGTLNHLIKSRWNQRNTP